jgi:hypothetical protein
VAISRTTEAVTIKPPRIESVVFDLEGTAPYVQLRFSQKAIVTIAKKMQEGSTTRKGAAREARSFEEDFQAAQHVSAEGWVGMHAGAFRNALISACRLVGFRMTLAKLSLFVVADGFDRVDGVPLVRIEGEPEMSVMPVRNATGVTDLRVRAMWREWRTRLRVRYDADQFTLQDITNLMVRVGEQVGVGEGRPDSKMSAGMGWGTFRVANIGHAEDGDWAAPRAAV